VHLLSCVRNGTEKCALEGVTSLMEGVVSLLSHREGDTMHRMTRTMVGAVTAAGLPVGGAGAAQAITSNTAFDGVMNRFQRA